MEIKNDGGVLENKPRWNALISLIHHDRAVQVSPVELVRLARLAHLSLV
jgi:hypothetical protein